MIIYFATGKLLQRIMGKRESYPELSREKSELNIYK